MPSDQTIDQQACSMKTALVPGESLDLLDSAQLAKLLGMNPNWPATARLRGDGPPFLKLGRMVRYRRGDVEQWLDGQRRTHTDTQRSA